MYVFYKFLRSYTRLFKCHVFLSKAYFVGAIRFLIFFVALLLSAIKLFKISKFVYLLYPFIVDRFYYLCSLLTIHIEILVLLCLHILFSLFIHGRDLTSTVPDRTKMTWI